MIRILLFCALAGALLPAQTAAPKPQMPAAPAPVADQLPPEAVVLTIHGLCPASADPAKSDSCVTNITKARFMEMIAAMSFNPRMLDAASQRGFAESYPQSMALAAAAESSGMDKDPKVQELLKIVRVRTLADAYRRSVQEKYRNPSPEEIEAWYQQNQAKYEQIQVDRIFLPRTSAKNPAADRAEFEKKAQATAEAVRERAARGEDLNKLQIEAYKSLDLTPPMTTDMGARGRGSFPSAVETDLFALRPGEVTKVLPEPGGFTFYRVRGHDTLPLSAVREGIAQEIAQKKIDDALRSVTGPVHSDLNEQFFAARPAGGRRSVQSPAPPPAVPPRRIPESGPPK